MPPLFLLPDDSPGEISFEPFSLLQRREAFNFEPFSLLDQILPLQRPPPVRRNAQIASSNKDRTRATLPLLATLLPQWPHQPSPDPLRRLPLRLRQHLAPGFDHAHQCRARHTATVPQGAQLHPQEVAEEHRPSAATTRILNTEAMHIAHRQLLTYIDGHGEHSFGFPNSHLCLMCSYDDTQIVIDHLYFFESFISQLPTDSRFALPFFPSGPSMMFASLPTGTPVAPKAVASSSPATASPLLLSPTSSAPLGLTATSLTRSHLDSNIIQQHRSNQIHGRYLLDEILQPPIASSFLTVHLQRLHLLPLRQQCA